MTLALLPVEGASPTFGARVFAKVDASGPCWEWTGGGTDGYGVVRLAARGSPLIRAHRAVWMLLVGEIPPGVIFDHRCRNRRCVNPDHLEPVTNRINILRGYSPPALNARKDHCSRGHNLERGNLMVATDGHRSCRRCKNDGARERYGNTRGRR